MFIAIYRYTIASMVHDPCYPDKAPQVDRIFRILSESIRRELVVFFEMESESNTASIEDVIAYLDERMPHLDRRTIAISLKHRHIPKLEASGWIDYDDQTGTIRYEGHGSARDYLQEVAETFEE